MTNLIHHKKTERFILLYALYRKSEGNMGHPHNLRDVASEEGLGYRSFRSAFDFLCRERLIHLRAASESQDHFYFASLTEHGLKAVESVFDDESQKSDYFPPYREMMM